MVRVPHCSAQVIGQEYSCGRCGYVWDLNDPEPPKCKTNAQARRDNAARHIAKLREQLK